ncbi:MAG: prepilin-type N-terminal cleavage/methylation domain-containing protein [Planctomycetota bacterium]|nr:prepilin-type N-terminal cleavage/methylation domain-containing protein [Planctomycetota bacterium]MCX8039326.1 prepilin-type N-terminal cleavage/methylation domain-containing protein [Planctomycetota bacterium]MDW8372092.1 prepilin-type N-terminal cleavage/methylation domain-containing protein [Planctomycetota bacterium]
MAGRDGGFSLIEVIITLSILVAALLLIVGQQANILTLQRSTRDSGQVDRVLQALINRFQTTPASHLATERAPWSIARYEQVSGLPPSHLPLGASIRGRDPLTTQSRNFFGNPVPPLDHLVALGLCAGSDVPADLRVYVEYYRALSYTDAAGVQRLGMLDLGTTSGAAFRAGVYNDPVQPAFGIRPAYQLEGWDPRDVSANNNPWMRGLIPAEHPLAIRVIAVWDDADPDPALYRPRQRRELFTAKAP